MPIERPYDPAEIVPASVSNAVREHFPNEDLELHEWCILHPEEVLDLEGMHVADIDQQKSLLKEIEKGLRKALEAYELLHPDVRRNLEHSASQARQSRDRAVFWPVFYTKLDGKNVPIETYKSVELFMRFALASLLGRSSEESNLARGGRSRRRAALSSAEEALTEFNMEPLTAQAKKGESWQKARLVSAARRTWKRLSGKNAPAACSGPFADFLSDLIAAYGKSWDAESTVKAWRARADREGDSF